MENGKAKIPEWAREIAELRARLGLSQAALGQRLQYSPVAVSRWERGAKEPTAEAYIRLGHLAEGHASWTFWSRAGLHAADIERKALATPVRVSRVFRSSRSFLQEGARNQDSARKS